MQDQIYFACNLVNKNNVFIYKTVHKTLGIMITT